MNPHPASPEIMPASKKTSDVNLDSQTRDPHKLREFEAPSQVMINPEYFLSQLPADMILPDRAVGQLLNLPEQKAQLLRLYGGPPIAKLGVGGTKVEELLRWLRENLAAQDYRRRIREIQKSV